MEDEFVFAHGTAAKVEKTSCSFCTPGFGFGFEYLGVGFSNLALCLQHKSFRAIGISPGECSWAGL